MFYAPFPSLLTHFHTERYEPGTIWYSDLPRENRGVMKREELARRLSQANGLSRAEARDQIDELVRKILASLRAGTPVEFPGAGRLVSRKPRKSEKG
jgi:DNA-binding protein